MSACTFIGHRDFSDSKKSLVYNVVKDLIEKEKVTTFYVGTNGGFDRLAYRVLCSLEHVYNIKVIVVLSYLNIKETYYDTAKTVFPDELTATPPKFAIVKRNNYMISRSQYMVCGIDDIMTNSYKFVQSAQKKGLRIINVGEYKL